MIAQRLTRRAYTGVTTLLFLASTGAQAASVALTPMPTVPTSAQCLQIRNQDDHAIILATRAKIQAEDLRWGNHYAGERLHTQDRIILQETDDQHEVGKNYSECLRQASESDATMQSNSSRDLRGGIFRGWLAGVEGATDSTAHSGTIASFSATAAAALRYEQKLEAAQSKLNFANNIIQIVLTGRPSEPSPMNRLRLGVDVASDLVGGAQPPWSSLATSIALNAIQAIAGDSLAQLDQSMMNFDASNLVDQIPDRMDVVTYTSLPPTRTRSDTRASDPSDASRRLDETVKGVTQLLGEVNRQIEVERVVERRKQLARQQAIQQQQVLVDAQNRAAQNAANAAAVAAAQQAVQDRVVENAKVQAKQQAEQRAETERTLARLEAEADTYVPPVSFMPSITPFFRSPSYSVRQIQVPRPNVPSYGSNSTCVSSRYHSCSTQ